MNLICAGPRWIQDLDTDPNSKSLYLATSDAIEKWDVDPALGEVVKQTQVVRIDSKAIAYDHCSE